MLRRCKADVVEFHGSVMYNETTEAKAVLNTHTKRNHPVQQKKQIRVKRLLITQAQLCE